jgi:hypothetical protein
MGTLPLVACATNSVPNDEDPDPWPPDADDDGHVFVNDVILLFWGKVLNPPSYSARSDANGDGLILVNDVILLFWGKVLTSCV